MPKLPRETKRHVWLYDEINHCHSIRHKVTRYAIAIVVEKSHEFASVARHDADLQSKSSIQNFGFQL
eukprot:g45854.t1